MTNAFGQKKNKPEKFVTKEVVLSDTLSIKRVPLNSIKSDQKYFIDALQKQLDEAKNSIKSDSIVDEDIVTNINNLIVSIKKGDPSWEADNYTQEVTYYSKYKIVFEDVSTPSSSGLSKTSSKVIQTGPRGGKYYINSNGKKTYVKKK